MVISILIACLGQATLAEVECSFNTRSSIEGNVWLGDHGFRVHEFGTELYLERRLADGSWLHMGTVQRFDQPEFIVFRNSPSSGPLAGRPLMLTVHQSGNGSLAIHHDSLGNALQFQRAWLYHGNCDETK
jgi:hypothetical protein